MEKLIIFEFVLLSENLCKMKTKNTKKNGKMLKKQLSGKTRVRLRDEKLIIFPFVILRENLCKNIIKKTEKNYKILKNN